MCCPFVNRGLGASTKPKGGNGGKRDAIFPITFSTQVIGEWNEQCGQGKILLVASFTFNDESMTDYLPTLQGVLQVKHVNGKCSEKRGKEDERKRNDILEKNENNGSKMSFGWLGDNWRKMLR